MKKRIKKRSTIAIVVGIILVLVTSFFIYTQIYTVIQGQKVDGRVVDFKISDSSDRTSPVIEYQFNSAQQTITPTYLFNTYRVDDTVPLYVIPNNITILALNNGFLLSLLGLWIIGLWLLIWGIRSIRKHTRIQEKDIIKLKRFGVRVHARYLRQESSPHIIGESPGVILILQEEDGERVFSTKAIFSEYSVKWLEEHVFDVYVNPNNDLDYYVDLEKHYGAHSNEL